MQKKLLNKYRLFQWVVIIIYIVGLAGFINPDTREIFRELTPYNLIFSITVLLIFHQEWNVRFVLVALIISSFGFFIEVIGVNTGMIFGTYVYGETLGLKAFETPLIIGINWLLLSYATFHIFKNLNLSMYIKAALSALVMLVYDFVLEPIAIKLDMWNWQNVSVPLKNYVAWFIIGYLMVILIYIFKVEVRNRLSTVILLSQFIFFLILNFIL